MTDGSFLLKALLSTTPASKIPTGESLSSEEENNNSLVENVGEDFEIGGDDEELELAASMAEKISRTEDDDDGYFTIRVPKYFQALFTLFVCFLLLLCTLSIIRQTKKFCQKSGCSKKHPPLIRVESDKDKIQGRTISSETNNCGGKENGDTDNSEAPQTSNTPRQLDYYQNINPLNGTGSTSQTHTKQERDNLKTKKVQFIRRGSGPFGEEALEFVGKTYKKRVKEVEQDPKHGKVPGHIKTQKSIKKLAKSQS